MEAIATATGAGTHLLGVTAPKAAAKAAANLTEERVQQMVTASVWSVLKKAADTAIQYASIPVEIAQAVTKVQSKNAASKISEKRLRMIQKQAKKELQSAVTVTRSGRVIPKNAEMKEIEARLADNCSKGIQKKQAEQTANKADAVIDVAAAVVGGGTSPVAKVAIKAAGEVVKGAARKAIVKDDADKATIAKGGATEVAKTAAVEAVKAAARSAVAELPSE